MQSKGENLKSELRDSTKQDLDTKISSPIKQIIGANTFNNQIMLYVQLQNSSYAWLPASLVGQHEPLRLIQFYESKLRFS